MADLCRALTSRVQMDYLGAERGEESFIISVDTKAGSQLQRARVFGAWKF